MTQDTMPSANGPGTAHGQGPKAGYRGTRLYRSDHRLMTVASADASLRVVCTSRRLVQFAPGALYDRLAGEGADQASAGAVVLSLRVQQECCRRRRTWSCTVPQYAATAAGKVRTVCVLMPNSGTL
jgi:hypothetical protein